jgi:hypothetical protein
MLEYKQRRELIVSLDNALLLIARDRPPTEEERARAVGILVAQRDKLMDGFEFLLPLDDTRAGRIKGIGDD